MFFTADDGIHGRELWRSDGTKRGTVLVKDINRDNGATGPQDLTAVGDLLFFTVDDGIHGLELWRSDGTRSGTVLVKDIDPNDDGGYFSGPASLIGVGETLFFSADDSVHGRALWKSDGTRSGTVLVKDIAPTNYDNSSYGPSLADVGGTLFLSADDGIHGPELWKSDGTEAGTVLVEDIRPGAAASYTRRLTGVGDTLFLSASDGIHGDELWKSDGSEAGTLLVKDLPEEYYIYSSVPEYLTDVAGTLFFTSGEGRRGYGGRLWKSDGTEAGTVLVKDIGSGGYSYASDLTAVGGTLFLSASDGIHGKELWKSDGTESGTFMVRDVHPTDFYSSSPSSLTDVGGTLFFAAEDGIHGRELWKSDGTRSGTVLVKAIDPKNDIYSSSGPSSLTDVGGTLFFTAEDGIHGRELWKSDGTRSGTVLVRDINAGGAFTVASKGTADTSKGTMRVRVQVAAAGRLVVAPAGGSLLKRSVHQVASAGTTKVTLRPTPAGLRILEKTGRLRVKARFTFTPCGGTGTSVVHRYTLRLR